MSIPEGFDSEAANQRVTALGEQFPDIGEKIDALRAEIEASGKSSKEAQFMVAEVLGLSYEDGVTPAGEAVFRSSAPLPPGDDLKIEDILGFDSASNSNVGSYDEKIDGARPPSADNPNFDPTKYAPQIPDSVIELKDSSALVALIGAVDEVLNDDRKVRDEAVATTGVQAPPQGIIKHLTLISAASKAHDFGVDKEEEEFAKDAAFGLLTEADKCFGARANLYVAGFCEAQDMGGIGEEQYPRAFAAFEIAAQNGDPKAETALGYYYLLGDEKAGIEADEAKASKYFSRAAAQGNEEAALRLDEIKNGVKYNPPERESSSSVVSDPEIGDSLAYEEQSSFDKDKSFFSKLIDGFFIAMINVMKGFLDVFDKIASAIFSGKPAKEDEEKIKIEFEELEEEVSKEESLETTADLSRSRAQRVEKMKSGKPIDAPNNEGEREEDPKTSWVEKVGGPKARERVSRTPDEGAVR